MSKALAALDEYQSRGLTDVERAAAETTVDFDAEQATCPACGSAFATTVTRCPECDLNFG